MSVDVKRLRELLDVAQGFRARNNAWPTDATGVLLYALPELLAVYEATLACAENGNPGTYMDLRAAIDSTRSKP